MIQKFIDKSTRNGCTVLKEDKVKAPFYTTHEQYAIYKNGVLDSIERNRKNALKYCDENMAPDTVFHIRNYTKLVYFYEYGHEPIFFNGFHIARWHRKPYEKALIDYDNHTPKDVTERYDAIAKALEETANPTKRHYFRHKPKKAKAAKTTKPKKQNDSTDKA